MARLTLVPTPVGNLGDITLRALEVLRSVDVVAAEDTRRSKRLLDHFGIERPLVRLDAHTMAERAPALLERHAWVAFVTDAGTPGISDPGAELARLALGRGDTLEVLPGATAFVPALVLSGLPLGRFRFEGFLPRRGSARRERLQAMVASDCTVAFYEAPTRVLATLGDLIELCGGDRPVSVSREISKKFETTVRGNLGSVLGVLSDTPLRGEVVVVLGPGEALPEPDDYARRAEELAKEGLRGRQLRTALEALGVPRNLAYKLALEHERE